MTKHRKRRPASQATSRTEESHEEETGASKMVKVDCPSVLPQSTMTAKQPTTEEKKLVFQFVKKTLDKGPMGLRAEFIAMKRANDFDKMKIFSENNPKGKNRYKDVGCLDSSRVKLADFADGDYIHANYVETPTSKKRFICTQAPLEKTCPDFWAMCFQEKVENILMLCNFTEKGAKKCHEYYPMKDKETAQFGDYSIKCMSARTMKLKGDSPSKIRVTTLEVDFGGSKLTTRHYHWVDWPDRGVPPPDMAVIQLLERCAPTKTPIVVHCSAGIGRTGSVVLIQYILEMIASNNEVEGCDKMLVRLREQRNNSVQTDHQYLFVHQVMLNYFYESKLVDATAKPHLDKFAKEYQKIVI